MNRNDSKMQSLNTPLPGKPDFMHEDYEETQELEMLGLYDEEITKQKAPDSRVFNPDHDPNYDPSQEDQIEAGKKKKEKPQHRIIKSKVMEDVVIEAEAISTMERFYSWIVVLMSFYAGMLAVRFYFMQNELKKAKSGNQQNEEDNVVVSAAS